MGSDSPQTSNSPIITFLYVRMGPAHTAECSLGHSCSQAHHVLQSVDSISWKCACCEVHGHRLSRNSCVFQQFLLLNGPDCEGRNVFEGGGKGCWHLPVPWWWGFFLKLYSWCTRKKKDAQNKLPLEVWGRKDICIDMAESLCHPPETITALLISYQISRSVVSDSL